MKQLFKYIITAAVCISLCYACGESDLNDPKGSKEIPAQITVDRVQNLNGKSIIYYTRPVDDNFKYVKAVYQTDTEERSVNASSYTDSVLVDGFGKEGEFEVKLYSVSSGETYSTPVVAKVNPLKPPYIIAFDDLKVTPTFGGIRVSAKNSEGMLTFYAYKKGDDGQWYEFGALYTTATEIHQAIRGLDAVETEVGIIIKDRFGHRTEMFTTKLTPWYEETCDKKKFNFLKIDNWESHTQPLTCLWDGANQSSRVFMNKFYPGPTTQVTIDLGQKYKLSRIEIHGDMRSATDFGGSFTNLFPKEIDFWGRNDDRTTGFNNNEDGTWERLTPLETLRRADGSVTPSTVAPLTNADRELALAGHEVLFDEDAPPVRYICFRCLSNYGANNTRFSLCEFTFFGTPEDKLN